MESETNSGSNSDEYLNAGVEVGLDGDDDDVSYDASEDDATEYDELFRFIRINYQVRVPIAKQNKITTFWGVHSVLMFSLIFCRMFWLSIGLHNSCMKNKPNGRWNMSKFTTECTPQSV